MQKRVYTVMYALAFIFILLLIYNGFGYEGVLSLFFIPAILIGIAVDFILCAVLHMLLVMFVDWEPKKRQLLNEFLELILLPLLASLLGFFLFDDGSHYAAICALAHLPKCIYMVIQLWKNKIESDE